MPYPLFIIQLLANSPSNLLWPNNNSLVLYTYHNIPTWQFQLILQTHIFSINLLLLLIPQ